MLAIQRTRLKLHRIQDYYIKSQIFAFDQTKNIEIYLRSPVTCPTVPFSDPMSSDDQVIRHRGLSVSQAQVPPATLDVTVSPQ